VHGLCDECGSYFCQNLTKFAVLFQLQGGFAYENLQCVRVMSPFQVLTKVIATFPYLPLNSIVHGSCRVM